MQTVARLIYAGLGRTAAQSERRRLTVQLELADQGEGGKFPLLLAQNDEDCVLAGPGTRLVMKYHPAGTRCLGDVGNSQNPAVVVMDDMDAEHLRIPAPRASGA